MALAVKSILLSLISVVFLKNPRILNPDWIANTLSQPNTEWENVKFVKEWVANSLKNLFTFADMAHRSCPKWSTSQSAPTILVLKTWVGLWPWKKSVPKYGLDIF